MTTMSDVNGNYNITDMVDGLHDLGGLSGCRRSYAMSTNPDLRVMDPTCVTAAGND